MKPTLYKCLIAAALVSVAAPSALAAPVPLVAALHDPYYDLIVDDARQQLYASVYSGDSIDVLALPDLNLITSIPVGAGPAGLDLAPSGDELAVALHGAGEIAFLDLDTLTVTARLEPAAVAPADNHPLDLLYGRPGRLYSVGDDDADFIHVFDTLSKTEVAHSSFTAPSQGHLSLSADNNFLYLPGPSATSEVWVISDVVTLTSQATLYHPHALCSYTAGKVALSLGHVWEVPTYFNLPDFPFTGAEVECAPAQNRLYFTDETSLAVYSITPLQRLWLLDFGVPLGVARLDAANEKLYISSPAGVQTFGTDFGPRAYLPLTLDTRPALYGQVTSFGVNPSGETLTLRRKEGGAWTIIQATTVRADGTYYFYNPPALGPGQQYAVWYENPGQEYTHLRYRVGPELMAYNGRDLVAAGDFDITNTTQSVPNSGATVSLPVQFGWVINLPNSSYTYAFALADPADNDPYFLTPSLGHVIGYHLLSLPPGFSYGTPYVWEVWVYTPDGGYGVSYLRRPVTFAASALDWPGFNLRSP